MAHSEYDRTTGLVWYTAEGQHYPVTQASELLDDASEHDAVWTGLAPEEDGYTLFKARQRGQVVTWNGDTLFIHLRSR